MSQYVFADGVIHDDLGEGFQEALAEAHRHKQRPGCMCRSPAVDMYVAKAGGKYWIKRMPGTGQNHSAVCSSYEAPPELSGRAEVNGGAIKHEPETGMNRLRCEFALARGATRGPVAAPAGGGEAPPNSVKAEANRLTLLGLLHYLWDEAGLTRWQPGFANKRSWGVVRRLLEGAAAGADVRGGSLARILYMPEVFDKDARSAQEARRIDFFGGFKRPQSSALMLTVGEAKAFEKLERAGGGYRLTIKHVPSVAFMMSPDLGGRFAKRYMPLMSAWGADETTRLVVAFTSEVDAAGVPNVQEIAIMNTLHDWLPFDNEREKLLLGTLLQQRRAFIKTLRYNYRMGHPMASAILTDVDADGVALFLPPADPAARAPWEAVMAAHSGPTWEWSEGEVPAFPARPPAAR